MKIRLIRLKLKNFKAIDDFDGYFNGKSAEIRARNGLGKTTLADAYFFILDDLNAQGQGKFSAAELDQAGNEKLGQDAEVWMELNIDGRQVILGKKQTQKITKGRNPVFKGHTTEYFIDDPAIPVSRKIYLEAVDSFLPAATWRALSDIYHIPQKMKPELRRELLLPFAGIDEAESDPKVVEILAGRDLETVRAGQVKMLNAYNTEVDRFPAVIDGLRQSLSESTGNEDDIKAQIADIDLEIEERMSRIAGYRTGEGVAKIKFKLAELATRQQQVEEELRHTLNAEASALNITVMDIRENISLKKQQLEAVRHAIKFKAYDRQDRTAKKDLLLKRWKEIKSATGETCPTCGQELPDTAANNERKAEMLREINTQGQQLSDEIKQFTADIQQFEARDAEYKAEIAKMETQLKTLESKIVLSKKAMMSDPRLDDIGRAKEELENQLREIAENASPQIAEVERDLERLKSIHTSLYTDLAKLMQQSEIKTKIAEKEKEFQALIATTEKCQARFDLIMAERERRAKFLEKNINKKFKYIQWKLFDSPIDGEKRPICDAMVDGVPFGVDLNTGARINAGLDCVLTLADELKVDVPIWIDNAESVTNWIDHRGRDRQVIKLIAEPGREELEIHVSDTFD